MCFSGLRPVSEFGLMALQPSYESRYAPEIALVLKLLLYRMGVWNVSERATPGLKLQNLRYAYGRDRSLPSTSSSAVMTCFCFFISSSGL